MCQGASVYYWRKILLIYLFIKKHYRSKATPKIFTFGLEGTEFSHLICDSPLNRGSTWRENVLIVLTTYKIPSPLPLLSLSLFEPLPSASISHPHHHSRLPLSALSHLPQQIGTFSRKLTSPKLTSPFRLGFTVLGCILSLLAIVD